MVDILWRMILNVSKSNLGGCMKRFSVFVALLSLLTFLLTPQMAFAIGKKPKQETSYDQPSVPPVQNKPNAREMQVATGQIPPINEEDKS